LVRAALRCFKATRRLTSRGCICYIHNSGLLVSRRLRSFVNENFFVEFQLADQAVDVLDADSTSNDQPKLASLANIPVDSAVTYIPMRL
jgi:hypothetical protein